MSEGKLVTLQKMRSGQSGRIVRIEGGWGLERRLNAMGVRPGKPITKLSSMLMRGPVTAQVDNTKLAIGFGMANRIIIELP